MKLRVYSNFIKTDTESDLVLKYIFPITFIDPPKKKKIKIRSKTGDVSYKIIKLKTNYFTEIIETEKDKIQIIPDFSEKSKDFLLTFLNKLKKKTIYLENNEYDEDENILVNNFKLLVCYLKMCDVSPTKEVLKKMGVLLQFFETNYRTLRGLGKFKIWWNEYSPKLKKLLEKSNDVVENKIILDNYHRLDLNNEDGYILNNRIHFKDFMDSFSTKSMTVPPRVIKNYTLINNSSSKLEKIILSNQQKFVSDYLNSNTPYRGLLLYHGLGSGKSGASISITNGYTDKKVVILLPASLKINYLQEIEKFGESAFKSYHKWQFLELPLLDPVKKILFYKEIFTNIINDLTYITDEELEFSYDNYINSTGSKLDSLVGKLITNIYISLQNSLLNKLKSIGFPTEIINDVLVKRANVTGIWVLNNKVEQGDSIINKETGEIVKVVKIDKRNIYGKKDTTQYGGGKCSLCGSTGTTRGSCPLNPDPSTKKNAAKHPNATLLIKEQTTKKIVPPIVPISGKDEVSPGESDTIISKEELVNFEHYTLSLNISDSDKKQICSQIKRHFNYKYQLCSYNAGAYTVINIFKNLINNFRELVGGKKNSEITTPDITDIMLKINSGEIENPFNNKVVVIDEIHNLISLIMPNNENVNFNGGIIFELLMRAENVNLVCLSGTPSINDIFEFSILYNIIKGPIKKINFIISQKKAISRINIEEINEFLKSYQLIDRFEINNNILSVTRIPQGFIKIINEFGEYTNVIKNEINDINDSDFIEIFIEQFTENFLNYSIIFSKYECNVIFDSILDTSRSWEERLIGDSMFIEGQINHFKNTYIDQDDDLLYPRNFKNKITGLTSFYNERKKDAEGNDIFPEVEVIDQNIEFSMYQFIKYCIAREDERKKEKQARLGKFIKGSTTIKSSFKTTTRQLSIFAFPPDVARITNKNRYDVEFLKEEINRFIVLIATGEDITTYKTAIQERINTTIIELKVLKNKFMKFITIELLQESFPENIFTDEIVLNDFTYNSKNKEFVEKLLNLLYRFVFLKKDEIIYILSEDGNLDNVLETIKEELDSYFLTDSDNFNIDFIFEQIAVDDEYEDLLQQQINRIVESDKGYLDYNNVVSNSPYNLSWLSPKYVKLFNNLIETPGSVFVYSQFLNAEGIGIFTKILDKNGFKEMTWSKTTTTTESKEDLSQWCSIVTSKQNTKGTFNDSDTLQVGNLIRWTRNDSDLSKIISTTHKVISVDMDEIEITKDINVNSMFRSTKFNKSELIKISRDKFSEISRCRYVLWTGKQTNIQQRVDILKKFNGDNNTYGQDCLILLATSSGAEGISLKNVRQVHIIEPYWNDVRTNQVIGRARRVKSHIALNVEDRNVKVYKYVNKFSLSQKKQISSISDLTESGITQEELELLITDIQKISRTGSSDTKDIDEDRVVYFFTQLLNKFIREIGKTDKNISTDEHLTIIAKKKANLLNSFLYLIKENSVDCVLNLLDNQISDPANLGGLTCHTPDIEEDDLTTNEGYLYKLNPLSRSKYSRESITQEKTKIIKDISIKYQIIDFTINNKNLGLKDIKLKCIVFPEKGKRILNNSSVYNYYSYFSINFFQEGKKLKIGKYINSNMMLNSEFLQYVKLFSIIDSCDNEIREENEEFKGNFLEDDERMIDFSALVNERYKLKLESERMEPETEDDIEEIVDETKWLCPLCDTHNNLTDSVCTNPECDMEFADV